MTIPSADAEYQRRASALASFSLLNGVEETHDLLARAASKGRHNLAEFIEELHQRGSVDKFPRNTDASLSLSLAKILVAQVPFPESYRYARVLFETFLNPEPHPRFVLEDHLAYLETLADARDADAFERHVARFGVFTFNPANVLMHRANFSNPFTGSPEKHAHWLHTVNTMYSRLGYEPLDLVKTSDPPLDRVLSAPARIVNHPLMVTVIVPTHNPDQRIATALRSLLAQSYANLQILVMDDGSTLQSAHRLLDAWSRVDQRVTVVRLRENRGTYVARNIALRDHARGDLITVHDDDDWSHPRKIEAQVAHLLQNPDTPANYSQLVRVTPDLHFRRINGNPSLTQANYSSLMVRREVLERLGPWDVVNRGADAELVDRIRRASGVRIPTVGTAPLSLIRVRDDSLTHGEIRRGYLDSGRRWYSAAYTAWHESVADELKARLRHETPASPRADHTGLREFVPAPANFTLPRRNDFTHQVDVLYVTDFRFPGGNSSLTANELEILASHGLRVGIMQLDSPILGGSNRIHPRILKIARLENISVLTTNDSIRSGLTILRHPTVLQFAPARPTRIVSQRAVVIVNHAPVDAAGAGVVYDLDKVLANAERLCGVVPAFAPESPLIRDLLTPHVPAGLVTDFNWTGIAAPQSPRSRAADPARVPIVGRHSRDDSVKWPEAAVLPSVYPFDSTFDVRVLGGADRAPAELREAINRSWTVYPFGSREVSDFLDELDFWVYFHHSSLHESFGMATLEAVSAGLVVVLPQYMRRTFGDSALYCEPEEVVETVRRLWADPVAYAAQVERSRIKAEELFGAHGLLERVRRLTVSSPPSI